MIQLPSLALGSAGHAPPINPGLLLNEPVRLQRARSKDAHTPQGARYVGRPTLWANPFQGRFPHVKSVFLHRDWAEGEIHDARYAKLGFSFGEADALRRWRTRLLRGLHRLVGLNLQCWCPLTSKWCHADTLLDLARRIAACLTGLAPHAGKAQPEWRHS